MKVTFFNDFLKPQLRNVPPVTATDLYGKTILITGGNVGIGYETAKHFATMNPGKVIITCRNAEKGQDAVKELQKATGFSNLEARILDLSNFASVVEFADAFEKDEERLDILVANASVMTAEYRVTEDGWEETIQVNNLSTLLYCVRLVPTMLKTAEKWATQPRIVLVGSAMHYYANIEPTVQEPNFLRKFSSKEHCSSDPLIMKKRYPDSKLLTLFLSRSLANILQKAPIIVNAVCPGYCRSALRRDSPRLGEAIASWLLDRALARTAEEGARQLIWAALAPNRDERMRGAWIRWMGICESSDYSISEAGLKAQGKIWGEAVEEIGRVDVKALVVLRNVRDEVRA